MKYTLTLKTVLPLTLTYPLSLLLSTSCHWNEQVWAFLKVVVIACSRRLDGSISESPLLLNTSKNFCVWLRVQSWRPGRRERRLSGCPGAANSCTVGAC